MNFQIYKTELMDLKKKLMKAKILILLIQQIKNIHFKINNINSLEIVQQKMSTNLKISIITYLILTQ